MNLSGCELALKSSGQAFRVPSPWGPFRFRPVPRERAIPPSFSTPHPRAVKGGAKHLDEERDGYGRSLHRTG